jgi:cytochrome c-type biogenesis protein CcmH/NrfG
LKLINKSIISDSGNVKAWNNLAKLYYELKNYDNALKCYSYTLRIQPDNAIAKEAISKIRSINGESKDELQDLLKLLNVDKNNPVLWCKMGKELLETGAIEKAIQCFQAALKIEPENIVAKDALVQIENKRKKNNVK